MVPTGIVPSAKLQSSSSRRLPLNLQYPPTSSLRAMKPTDPIQITQLEHGTKLQKGDLWTFLDATEGEPGHERVRSAKKPGNATERSENEHVPVRWFYFIRPSAPLRSRHVPGGNPCRSGGRECVGEWESGR